MKRPQFTYKGAFHYVISRGYGGRFIFGLSSYKDYLLKLIIKEKEKSKIRTFTYCILRQLLSLESIHKDAKYEECE